jgi:acyl-CoA dehydrogenase
VSQRSTSAAAGSDGAEFEERLAWAARFLAEEILPLETVADDLEENQWAAVVNPLKEEVKAHGLWACHLGPELGGQGYGQVRLCRLNEIVGRSPLAPPIFGNQAPDSGNAEIIAIAGTADQRLRWLNPLLDGSIRSAFSMTELAVSGSDPTMLQTTAQLDGDDWVIDGHKWFTSQGSDAELLIVIAMTDPDAPAHRRHSVFLVPATTPGVQITRDIPTMQEPYPPARPSRSMKHAEVTYASVRVPADALLGERGAGLALAQKRLGPGRLHHVMRWIGQAERALDMLCERAVSRTTRGAVLADHQMVQEFVAASVIDIQATRMLCLDAAAAVDGDGVAAARDKIAMAKVFGARVLHDVIDRSIQVHGALGYSADLPLEEMYRRARAARLVDGADEVHKAALARHKLRGYRKSPGGVPTEHIPSRRADAVRRWRLDDIPAAPVSPGS